MVVITLSLCVGRSGAEPPLAGEPPKDAPTQAQPLGLRITSEITLPPELNQAKDVRWATDRSVFLAAGAAGTSEIKLEPAGEQIREIIPGRFKPGGFAVSYQIAASSKYFVVARAARAIAWRRLDDPARIDEAVEFIQAIDLWQDRLLIVGARRDDKGGFATDGAIAWIGSLDKKLADLKPLVYAMSGPGAHEMNACGNVHLGAARFLEDGSFIILPGAQPGLSFFDREGKLLRSVDTISLGIDSDCGLLAQNEIERIAVDYAARMAWINNRRTVDTVIVTPEGPGLVVRSVEKGRVRWRLDIVKPDGRVSSHAVPIEAPDEFYHLRGDMRSGKLVFLLFQTPPSDSNYAQPQLLTALLPEGLGKPDSKRR